MVCFNSEEFLKNQLQNQNAQYKNPDNVKSKDFLYFYSNFSDVITATTSCAEQNVWCNSISM